MSAGRPKVAANADLPIHLEIKPSGPLVVPTVRGIDRTQPLAHESRAPGSRAQKRAGTGRNSHGESARGCAHPVEILAERLGALFDP